MDAFEGFVRGGAELRGVDVDETEVHIMRMIQAVYGPPLEALQRADLTGVWAEADIDPGRPPSPLGGRG